MKISKDTASIYVLALCVLVVCFLSLALGAVQIPFNALVSIVKSSIGIEHEQIHDSQQTAVFYAIRLPRTLMGAVVGATLSVSGAAIQGLFRNPLAEPGIIGISSGATFFAVLMIVLGGKFAGMIIEVLGYYALAFAAFTGALITTFFVYKFSVRKGQTDISLLLLIGIAINALVMSLTGFLTYLATDEQLRNITFWSLGSLGGSSWTTLRAVVPFSIVSIAGICLFSKSLNAFALGEAQAQHLGISTQKIKRWIILFSAIGVGACVALTGLIGFISLVVPHIIRMSIGADHKTLLPASVLLGAGLLVAADLIARTIVSPTELPIGILTAFIGVPIFLYIILKERKTRLKI